MLNTLHHDIRLHRLPFAVWLDCSLADAMVVGATGLFVLAWIGSNASKHLSRGRMLHPNWGRVAQMTVRRLFHASTRELSAQTPELGTTVGGHQGRPSAVLGLHHSGFLVVLA